ncbi:MAG: hypothetical protein Q9209_002157 [Squamulea sp. 1 TL-2023]
MAMTAKQHSSPLPERSSLVAWKQSERDFKGVALTGSLKFLEQPGDGVFEFKLNPLRLEPTYRLARKFGYDRFFVLSIPSMEPKHLPLHMRSDPKARESIVDWLVHSEHAFLGRKWRAFYVKPESNRKAGLSTLVPLDDSKFRVYLFAESGYDFLADAKCGDKDPKALNHPPKERKKIIEWLMPAKANREQRALKFFARLALAKAVTEALNLDYTPSIFQGRIAGAKGVWIIDALGESIGSNGDIWIEITDSQLKFDDGGKDNLHPDLERVTFEVLAFSRPLTEASLNFQLMTILVECKVPSKVFCDLLEADLTKKVADLEVAMQSGLAIRKWNQEVNPVSSERIAHGVEMQGGLPSALPEKINWFVEHGFEPHNCCRLKDLLYLAIAGYCNRLESRMNIGIPKSTYAFMIADPLAMLEEVEPFQNAPVVESLSLDAYGIETEKTTVSDLLASDDYMDHFLRLGFDFNLQSNLLGACTSYFERLCYQRNDICSPAATKLAQLLGHLVDRPKGGVIFGDEQWNAYRRMEGLPKSLPRPAYKDKMKGVPKKTNLIDCLVFEIAKGVREKALGDFSERFKNVGTYDTDITTLYKYEVEEAKRDQGIKKALADLKSDIQTIKDFWTTHCMRSDELAAGEEASGFDIRARRKSVVPFQAIAERVRDDFLALRPSSEAIALSPIVERWNRECQSTPSSTPPSSSLPPNRWTLLKASTIFYYHHDRNFIWYAAGVELGILKSHAKGVGTYRSVVGDVWECFKVDGKAVDRKRRKAEGDQGFNVGEQRIEEDDYADEYGDWGWMDGVEPNG